MPNFSFNLFRNIHAHILMLQFAFSPLFKKQQGASSNAFLIISSDANDRSSLLEISHLYHLVYELTCYPTTQNIQQPCNLFQYNSLILKLPYRPIIKLLHFFNQHVTDSYIRRQPQTLEQCFHQFITQFNTTIDKHMHNHHR